MESVWFACKLLWNLFNSNNNEFKYFVYYRWSLSLERTIRNRKVQDKKRETEGKKPEILLESIAMDAFGSSLEHPHSVNSQMFSDNNRPHRIDMKKRRKSKRLPLTSSTSFACCTTKSIVLSSLVLCHLLGYTFCIGK